MENVYNSDADGFGITCAEQAKIDFWGTATENLLVEGRRFWGTVGENLLVEGRR
ncbi:hypothetical protein [Microseira wollei]|uniref:Uncharacterized protein n=1 Tax=Microseira wollei NIES-4236 TaxID=2530354 RepID=A0AAV3XRI9_9CYAN|nr:hypothetical protein [Microseira wollei]GET42970.1 hypothetical protein MiSe_77890 [Microseira wollei NIES-4236]